VVTLMLASTGETVYCNTFWLAVAHTSESPGSDSVTVGFALTVMVASASLLSWQLPSPWEALSLSVNVPGVQVLAEQLTDTVMGEPARQSTPTHRQT
jgi:hypothetical protein